MRHRTYQKTVGQPVVYDEHHSGNEGGRQKGGEELVPIRTRGQLVITGKFTVIDVRNALVVEVGCSVRCDKQEHGRCVGYELPLDTFPYTVDWIEQSVHTLEK